MANSSSIWRFSRGFVYDRNRVYILAHLPELEEQRMHFTQVLRWTGEWGSFRVDFPCTALCAMTKPEPTLLCMGTYGLIHLATSLGFFEETVDATEEAPANRGIIRDIRKIGNNVYVAGMGRQVYHRDSIGNWARIDQGVVVPLNHAMVAGFNSIDGFSEDDIYAAGWSGEIWHYNGKQWRQIPSPTNLKLERIICVNSNEYYICGQMGLLLRGDEYGLKVIEHGATEKQLWGMEWFENKLWISTDNSIFYLDEKDQLVRVDPGVDNNVLTCGWLHSNDGVMWSFGGQHLLSTKDGIDWQLYVVP